MLVYKPTTALEPVLISLSACDDARKTFTGTMPLDEIERKLYKFCRRQDSCEVVRRKYVLSCFGAANQYDFGHGKTGRGWELETGATPPNMIGAQTVALLHTLATGNFDCSR